MLEKWEPFLFLDPISEPISPQTIVLLRKVRGSTRKQAASNGGRAGSKQWIAGMSACLLTAKKSYCSSAVADRPLTHATTHPQSKRSVVVRLPSFLWIDAQVPQEWRMVMVVVCCLLVRHGKQEETR